MAKASPGASTPPPTPRVLVVDDEEDILNLLEFNLTKAGYRVTTAADGPEAIELAASIKPDLILLDIMLPNMEGTEVLKRLKANRSTRDVPVIMLTAKGEEVDRVLGFELGCEDYITKPFSPRELILRVKAILKRGGAARESAGDGPIEYGGVAVDTSGHKATLKGRELKLTATEFNLLRAFLENRGRVLTRDNLLDRAWGTDCFVTPRTVDTHVRRLRVKLKGAGRMIETVRGVGYRFEG